MVQHIAHLKPQGPGLPRLDLGGERKTAWRAPCSEKEAAWGMHHLPLLPGCGSSNSPSVAREKGNRNVNLRS